MVRKEMDNSRPAPFKTTPRPAGVQPIGSKDEDEKEDKK